MKKISSKYEIKKHLGSGCVGDIYHAIDPAGGKDVLVMLIPAYMAANNNFRNDVQKIMHFQHRNISRYLRLEPAGDDADNYLLVAEYFDGITLQEVLKQKPYGKLTNQDILHWLLMLANALDYAHRDGVTHGDLSLKNILVNKKEIKIVDFALARHAAKRTVRQPEYLPEEKCRTIRLIIYTQQVANKIQEYINIQKADDQYALALIAYELITGKALPTKDPVQAIRLDQISPPEIGRALQKALDPSPQSRFPSCEHFCLELQCAWQKEQINQNKMQQPPVPPAQPEDQQAGKKSGSFGKFCLKLIIIGSIATAIWAFWHDDKETPEASELETTEQTQTAASQPQPQENTQQTQKFEVKPQPQENTQQTQKFEVKPQQPAVPVKEVKENADRPDEVLPSAGKVQTAPQVVVDTRTLAEKFHLAQAENGDVNAQFQLAQCYYQGNNTPRDPAKALKWFERAAAQGHLQALRNAAECYATGSGTDKNLQKAVDFYQKAVEKGDDASAIKLGKLYEQGQELPINHAEALKWYIKAAQRGNIDAMKYIDNCIKRNEFMLTFATPREEFTTYKAAADLGSVNALYALGVCYELGTGVDSNAKQAQECFLKAARRNQPEAQYALGKSYEIQGTSHAMKQAVDWYTKAANAGNKEAMFSLGKLYERGTEADLKHALYWYQKLADLGHEEAMQRLEILKRSMPTPVVDQKKPAVAVPAKTAASVTPPAASPAQQAEQLYQQALKYESEEGYEAKALEYFQQAADLGHTEAQYKTALIYHEGRNVAPDTVKASKYYHKAALAGHLESQINLAQINLDRNGLAYNPRQAVKMLELAIKKDSAEAQYLLGECYSEGRGTRRSNAEAFKYFSLAANKQHPKAQYELALCYLKGRGVRKNNRQAKIWFEKSAEQGHAFAQYQLGYLLEFGANGVPANGYEANKWYRKAAQQGYKKAKDALKRQGLSY